MSRLIALALTTSFLLGCDRKDEATIPHVVLTTEVSGLDADPEAPQPADPMPQFSEESLPFDQSLISQHGRLDWLDPQAFLDQPEQSRPNSSLLVQRIAARKAEFYRGEDGERAVRNGLLWLVAQQHEDGCWAFDIGEKHERIAATGMALLPFLGAGYTHVGCAAFRQVPRQEVGVIHKCGPMPRPEFELVEVWRTGTPQRTIQAGLAYLCDRCPLSGSDAGRMSGNPSAQALATLALCEAYALTKDKTLLPFAQAAINHIVKTQEPNGSWGYVPGIPGDISIVGWQVQALHAARLSKGIVVPESTLKKTVAFLDHVSGGSRKSRYGYTDNSDAVPATTRTAIGLLCRYHIDGWGPDNAGMAEGVAGLMQRSPVKSTASPDVYFYYHASQVVRYYEGDEWKTWNEGPKTPDGIRKGGMRDWLVSLQVKKYGTNQGSFAPDASWIGRNCGRLGMTAMCVLTLETPYRYPSRPDPPFIKIMDAPKAP